MSKKKNKIDTLLDNCNYKVDPDYVPSQFAYLMINFIKAVQGDAGGEVNASPISHYKMLDSYDDNKKDRVVNLCHRGFAKMEPGSNLIPTPDGYVPMKDLKVGDIVFDRYGSPTRINYKTPPMRQQCYEVTFSSGTKIIFGKDHNILTVSTSALKNNNEYAKVYTVEEMYESQISREIDRRTTKCPKKVYKYKVPVHGPVQFERETVPVEAYLMGIYLALGSKISPQITNTDVYFNRVTNLLTQHGISFTQPNSRIIKLTNPILCEVLNDGKGGIPTIYMRNSFQVRMELLRGLLDSHSIYSNSRSVSFVHRSKVMAEDVKLLVLSLGGLATLTKVNNTYRVKVRIKIDNPFKYHRGRKEWRPAKYKTIPIVDIQKVDVDEDCFCIQVEADNHCYLTKDYIVTHNTTLNEYVILLSASMGGLPNFGRFKYGIYVSDTIGNGIKRMRNRLDVQVSNSEFLKDIFEEVRITDERWYFRTKDGKEMVWTGHGVEKPPRGSVELRERFSVALLDDLFSDKNANSPKILQNIRHTIYSAIVYGLNPQKQKIIWSGTPFNASDPLYQAVNSTSWFSNVYPVCEKFPCSKEEFRGSWEDRFNYEYVNKMYSKAIEDKIVSSFYRELMLAIAHDEFRLVTSDMIGTASRTTILKNRDHFNFYIVTDFATKEADANDYSVAMVIAVNSIGNIYIVDGFCEKQTMLTNINELLRLAQKWKVLSVGLEVSGQQGGFLSIIEEKMMETNIYFTIAREKSQTSQRYGKKGFHPVTNKLNRFLAFYPKIEGGKLYVCKEIENTDLIIEMYEELELVTREAIKSLNDDVIDTLSMIQMMDILLPSGDAHLSDPAVNTIAPKQRPKSAAERELSKWIKQADKESTYDSHVSIDESMFYNTDDSVSPISSYFGED